MDELLIKKIDSYVEELIDKVKAFYKVREEVLDMCDELLSVEQEISIFDLFKMFNREMKVPIKYIEDNLSALNCKELLVKSHKPILCTITKEILENQK